MRAILRYACVLSLLCGPVASEPGPIGRWLMNEPVSLWDRGIVAARETAERAAETIGSEGHGAPPLSGARYEWDKNEIIIVFHIREFVGVVTHENCNRMRRAFIGALTGGAHTSGSGGYSKELIHSAVGHWFSHEGYQSKGQDKKLAEKLTRIVFVETIVRNKQARLVCKERIMSPDAPSKPWNPPWLTKG